VHIQSLGGQWQTGLVAFQQSDSAPRRELVARGTFPSRIAASKVRGPVDRPTLHWLGAAAVPGGYNALVRLQLALAPKLSGTWREAPRLEAR
jgi:hypothetical protein